MAVSAAAEAADRRAWARSTPRGAAAELASPGGRPTADQVREVALRLAESPPYFVVLRPQPGR
ncbi:MAG: hypothetical protein M5U28_32925 [Sandaracinaceae bacterium]|nr:hypothetical protein [Sandaracinaceae bacterium]